MNAENTIKDGSKAIGLFRGIFQVAVGYSEEKQTNIMTIDPQEFLLEAERGKNLRKWYIENDGITGEELGHFEEIMLDYLDSLRLWIRQSAHPEDLEAGITTFFAQVFR